MTPNERIDALFTQGCNCAAVDNGVGPQHEPLCGFPTPEDIRESIQEAVEEATRPVLQALLAQAITTEDGSCWCGHFNHNFPGGHTAACWLARDVVEHTVQILATESNG